MDRIWHLPAALRCATWWRTDVTRRGPGELSEGAGSLLLVMGTTRTYLVRGRKRAGILARTSFDVRQGTALAITGTSALQMCIAVIAITCYYQCLGVWLIRNSRLTPVRGITVGHPETDMFQGIIPIGTRVTATLQLDQNASGSAALLIAWSAGGGTGDQDAVLVTPGQPGTVSVRPLQESFLRVFVDMGQNTDAGTLNVTPRPTERITGDTTWTYSVEGDQ